MKPSETLWRTLIRVVDIDSNYLYVIIPGWNVYEIVTIPIANVPSEILALAKHNFRCHAQVNIGAYVAEELKFEQWETE